MPQYELRFRPHSESHVSNYPTIKAVRKTLRIRPQRCLWPRCEMTQGCACQIHAKLLHDAKPTTHHVMPCHAMHEIRGQDSAMLPQASLVDLRATPYPGLDKRRRRQLSSNHRTCIIASPASSRPCLRCCWSSISFDSSLMRHLTTLPVQTRSSHLSPCLTLHLKSSILGIATMVHRVCLIDLLRRENNSILVHNSTSNVIEWPSD
jgi:hypothetical protein